VLIIERWLLGRLRHRRFYSLAELNNAIGELLQQLNDERPIRRLGVTRRALFEELDRPHLNQASMADMAKMGDAAKPDLNDVKYDAFLANDRTLADPEVIKVEPAGRVLLRIINSSSMSAYHIDLGPLDGELTAVEAGSFNLQI
jgi:hypothetical protein